MKDIHVVEGTMQVPAGARFALCATRFNSFIVNRLVEGAVDALVRHGGAASDITLYKVPGSWELPQLVARVARDKKHDAIVALGAVIRGSTPHFEYISAEVTKGLAHVAMDSGIPVTFGVLTTDTIEQAVERAGTKAGNKGADAALAAIELLSLLRAMG